MSQAETALTLSVKHDLRVINDVTEDQAAVDSYLDQPEFLGLQDISGLDWQHVPKSCY